MRPASSAIEDPRASVLDTTEEVVDETSLHLNPFTENFHPCEAIGKETCEEKEFVQETEKLNPFVDDDTFMLKSDAMNDVSEQHQSEDVNDDAFNDSASDFSAEEDQETDDDLDNIATEEVGMNVKVDDTPPIQNSVAEGHLASSTITQLEDEKEKDQKAELVLHHENLNPFAENISDIMSASPSTNPFDALTASCSSSSSSSSNPFGHCDTHAEVTSKTKKKGRPMPSPTVVPSPRNFLPTDSGVSSQPRSSRKTMPLPMKSPSHFFPDEGLARTSRPLSSSQISGASSEGMQATARPTPPARRMPLGPKASSCSNLMPRLSESAASLYSSSPTSSPSASASLSASSQSPTSASAPSASAVSVTAHVAMPRAEEVQLIKMGFVKQEVEACICQHQDFQSALSSFSASILENIQLHKSVKNIFQTPLETRVGSWMPTQSGASNHIVFYIKVSVRGSNGYAYNIEKTYKEFLKLKKDLSTPIFQIIPSGLQHKFEDNRSYFKNDTEEVLDERREMLHKWLRGVCRLPELMISERIHAIIFDFLLYDDNVDINRLLL